MMTAGNAKWIDALGLSERRPPEFFRAVDEIDFTDRPFPQAHAMRRAWKEMALDGILCCGNVPVVYFKEVAQIDRKQIRRLQCQLWNQGIAPTLAVISPTEVYIYSGLALPAKEDEEIDQADRLVTVLNQVANALELRQFAHNVELGNFFRDYPRSFNPKQRVDRYLLQNLDAAREKLSEASSGKLDPKTIHALLGRVIFTCYLIDREVIESYFKEAGIVGCKKLADVLRKYKPSEAKKALYALFQQLQKDFNGDMFDGDLEAESKLIQTEHIRILDRFLQGDNLQTGQMSLGFWAYDFSFIPIETISAIYEQFLNAEDAEQRRKIGAYYTPRFLAEVVLDTALDGWDSLLDKRFLDPACGSGIFLVGIFNRLAEEWRRNNQDAHNEKRAEALVKILRHSIFGIDANETACRIAAFSLYLALLDHLSPRDIQKLQEKAKGQILPKLISYRGQGEDHDRGKNIFCRDFFEENLPLFADDSALPADGVDLVVGNPPWGPEPKGQRSMQEWCERAGVPVAQKQLAHGFLWKAPHHLRASGRVCFLLPAGIILNHQEKALNVQREWLSTYKVEQILNLSDMSFYLFDEAIRPALIARYGKERPTKYDLQIEYLTPKTEIETLRAEMLTVAPEDRNKIRLREVLSSLNGGNAPLVWKQSLWGTPRDKKLLDRLSLLPQLSEVVGQAGEEKRWIIAQGFQPEGANDNPEKSKLRPWSNEHLMLEGKSNNIDLVVLESDCHPLRDTYQRLRRLPRQDIFLAPHVIVTQGLRVAYADFDVVFRHSLQGIHGAKVDRQLLMFLAAFLNSALAQYFLFHTSSNWGIERDKVHEGELLRLPFPLPEATVSPTESKEIIKEVSSLMKSTANAIEESFLFDRAAEVAQTRKNLLPLIYRYYDIDEFEQVLIEDTINVWEPSATPNRGTWPIPALELSRPEQRREYVEFLRQVLDEWASRSPYKLTGKVLLSPQAGSAIVILEKTTNREEALRYEEQEFPSLFDHTLKRISSLIHSKQRNITFLRNLKVFDTNKLYIFKPLARRFWTKTSALNDADEIAGAIITSSYKTGSYG